MKQKGSTISGLLQKFDLFGQSTTFTVRGKQNLTTNFGALVSLLIMCFTVFYGYQKFLIMYNRQDSLQ